VSARLPLLRIYVDLVTARVLLGIAPSAKALLSAEDHRFLAERYAQLATRWRRIGCLSRAEANDEKAARHAGAAGLDDPPPALAVGLPVPWPYTMVDARARVLPGRWTPPSSHASPTPR
jgi:hypothetical protein